MKSTTYASFLPAVRSATARGASMGLQCRPDSPGRGERGRAYVLAMFFSMPYRPDMAAANASARGQRAAILASPLHELTGFYLAVDCLAPRCNGERTFAVAELASFYGRDSTVGQVLRRMRCSGACGERVGAAAWLVTGPILNARVSPRRVPLLGAEARGSPDTAAKIASMWITAHRKAGDADPCTHVSGLVRRHRH
jgi:hypothetical protein